MPPINSPNRSVRTRPDAISPLTEMTIDSTIDNSQQQEDSTATFTSNETSRTPINMDAILKKIENGDTKAILLNKDLHYYFLKHCVVNVITRKKWKENCARNDFYRFITPSDEGFAFLTIDNNIERYREMEVNTDPDFKHFAQPKYTTVTMKGASKNIGKGWNDKGKIEFQRYTELVIEKRSDKTWLEKRARAIKKLVNRERKDNKKRLYDEMDTENEVMDNEAKQRWNQFMMNSVSNINIESVAL